MIQSVWQDPETGKRKEGEGINFYITDKSRPVKSLPLPDRPFHFSSQGMEMLNFSWFFFLPLPCGYLSGSGPEAGFINRQLTDRPYTY
jgi:hypothetical protein